MTRLVDTLTQRLRANNDGKDMACRMSARRPAIVADCRFKPSCLSQLGGLTDMTTDYLAEWRGS
jgi:hypothetical protein